MGEPLKRAILLAGGLGRRLGGEVGALPKCLLRFGGETLLERHLKALVAHDVECVDLVLGYRHRDIEAELCRLSPPLSVHPILNPCFELGSALSVLAARASLQASGELLLMDADVLYPPELLGPLFRSSGSGLLMDRSCELGDAEAVKVCSHGGRIVEFGKQVDPGLEFDELAESVGFFRLSEGNARRLFRELIRLSNRGAVNAPYETALRAVLLSGEDPFEGHEISGLPWIEIDFPEDLERARTEIWPRIESRSPPTHWAVPCT